jgi:hypothetical protein
MIAIMRSIVRCLPVVSLLKTDEHRAPHVPRATAPITLLTNWNPEAKK